MLTLSRTVTFSAAHRLFSPDLSQNENARIFGKCSSPGGHGHNYSLTVTVAGDVDPATGMIMNVSDLTQLISTHVLERFDHRDLNNVPCLEGKTTTMENIIRVIADLLAPPLHNLGVALHRLELKESTATTVTLECHD